MLDGTCGILCLPVDVDHYIQDCSGQKLSDEQMSVAMVAWQTVGTEREVA